MEVQLKPYNWPYPSAPFISAVNDLPETYNENTYMQFFANFGTHFQAKTTFGAAYYVDAFYTA